MMHSGSYVPQYMPDKSCRNKTGSTQTNISFGSFFARRDSRNNDDNIIIIIKAAVKPQPALVGGNGRRGHGTGQQQELTRLWAVEANRGNVVSAVAVAHEPSKQGRRCAGIACVVLLVLMGVGLGVGLTREATTTTICQSGVALWKQPSCVKPSMPTYWILPTTKVPWRSVAGFPFRPGALQACLPRVFPSFLACTVCTKCWDVSQVRDMSALFRGTSFHGALNSWDVSRVTDMSSLLEGHAAYRLPLFSWDVSKVKNMRRLFYGCASFNNLLASWDTSSAENMAEMFLRAELFNFDITGWNTSKVTDMQAMCENALVFDQALTRWDVSRVQNIKRMFKGSFLRSSLRDWDVSNVRTMEEMVRLI